MRIDCFPCIRLRPPIGLYDNEAPSREGMVKKFMRTVYAPSLLRREVKQLVLVAFGGLFLAAIIGIQHITLGLGKYLWVCNTTISNTRHRSTSGPPIRIISGPILQ